jgi:DNA-binding Lrp family transcriptional regulator
MVSAFVLVNCRFPFDVKIADKVSKLPFVSSVYRTEGRYDLLVKLNADTKDKLKETISSDIDTIGGIDGTITLTIEDQ